MNFTTFSTFRLHEKQIENFILHLDSSTDQLILESLPKTDYIKEIRKIGVAKANSLGLTSTETFEKRLKEGFYQATEELLKASPKERIDLIKSAKTTFKKFLSERTSEANKKLSDDNKPTSTKIYASKSGVDFTGGNHKTKLSTSEGFLTKGLSLPPFNTAYPKFNCCTAATKECKASCLGLYAGGAKTYPETAFLGKLVRLQFMVEYPKETAILIHSELAKNEQVCSDKSTKGGEKFKAGFRANITSDIDFIKLFPKEFFEVLHEKTQFYDYTKDSSRLNPHRIDPIHGKIEKPKNYFLSLSHTGTGHKESNDIEAVKALDKGHVITMVVYGGKGTARKTLEVKGVVDDFTGKKYKISDGDLDDNVFDRHSQIGADQGTGVVSLVKLKGTTKEKAGNFANEIGEDGWVHLNSKPKDQPVSFVPRKPKTD